MTAKQRYVAVLIILGVVALGALLVPLWPGYSDAWIQGQEVVRAVGDASFVAFFIALAVEPYLRSRFQSETRSDVLWGLFNPQAPDAYQEALAESARSKTFSTSVTWDLDFSWEDDARTIVRVTSQARSEVVTYESGGYRPSVTLWVVPSTGEYKSRYLLWDISAPGVKGWDRRNSFSEDELHSPTNPLATEDSSGRIVLDEKTLAAGRSIPAGKSFTFTRKTRMYRTAPGYMPLVYSRPALTVFFDITGSALGDLEVEVLHVETRGQGGFLQTKTSAILKDIQTQGVTMAGQVTLISWKRVTPK